jgi:hypothetical protein
MSPQHSVESIQVGEPTIPTQKQAVHLFEASNQQEEVLCDQLKHIRSRLTKMIRKQSQKMTLQAYKRERRKVAD